MFFPHAHPRSSRKSLLMATNIYSTTCSDMAETIGTCHEKAKRTCKQGYVVLSENIDSSGIHRGIRFQCKD